MRGIKTGVEAAGGTTMSASSPAAATTTKAPAGKSKTKSKPMSYFNYKPLQIVATRKARAMAWIEEIGKIMAAEKAADADANAARLSTGNIELSTCPQELEVPLPEFLAGMRADLASVAHLAPFICAGPMLQLKDGCRLAWLLRKVDMLKSRSVVIFCKAAAERNDNIRRSSEKRV